jgi:rhodanese-related sulfurtransferase
MIAASWLAANGFADVSDLVGGYGAWAQMQGRGAMTAALAS